jgi:hypothetical protein
VCYLDEMSPRSWEFPEGHRYGERPYDFGKIWWSLHLAQLGYTSLYLDNDVATIKDPLAADIVQSPYDLQVTSSGTCVYMCTVSFWCHWYSIEQSVPVILTFCTFGPANRASVTSEPVSSREWAPFWMTAASCTG